MGSHSRKQDKGKNGGLIKKVGIAIASLVVLVAVLNSTGVIKSSSQSTKVEKISDTRYTINGIAKVSSSSLSVGSVYDSSADADAKSKKVPVFSVGSDKGGGTWWVKTSSDHTVDFTGPVSVTKQDDVEKALATSVESKTCNLYLVGCDIKSGTYDVKSTEAGDATGESFAQVYSDPNDEVSQAGEMQDVPCTITVKDGEFLALCEASATLR